MTKQKRSIVFTWIITWPRLANIITFATIILSSKPEGISATDKIRHCKISLATSTMRTVCYGPYRYSATCRPPPHHRAPLSATQVASAAQGVDDVVMLIIWWLHFQLGSSAIIHSRHHYELGSFHETHLGRGRREWHPEKQAVSHRLILGLITHSVSCQPFVDILKTVSSVLKKLKKIFMHHQ